MTTERVFSVTPTTDPLRPRDWRWRRAQTLARRASNCSYAPFDDDHVKRAHRFLVKRKVVEKTIVRRPSVDADALTYELMQSWADLMFADNIWTGSKFIRWAIEALVLTRMSAEDIAKEVGCEVHVVEAYELYFYDVRSRLDNSLYIINELLSPAITACVPGGDADFYWKGIAYWRGLEMLKSYWTYGEISSDTKKQLSEMLQSMRDKNTAKAAMARNVNSRTAREFMDEYLTDKQITEGNKNLSEVEETMANGAAQLLQAVGFAVASTSNAGAVEGRVTHTIKELASGSVFDTTTEKVIDVETESATALRPIASRVTESDVEAPKVDAEAARAEARKASEARKAALIAKLRDPRGKKGLQKA